MTLPLFLDLDHTLRLHRSLIEHYGGTEGIRDVGLLQSAIATPQAAFGGEHLHRDLFEMAAELARGAPESVMVEAGKELVRRLAAALQNQ